MKLSKAHKKLMAEMLFAEAKEIGLTLKMSGKWVSITPPNKVPARFLRESSQCGEEFAAIVKASTNPPEENHG